MKYIDAELLRKKIAEQIDSLPREVGRSAGTITSKGYGMMQAFQIMRSIIDSLQQEQPEVDLERDAVQFCFDKGLNVTPYQAKTIAHHFYKLGLNERKEEKL